METHVIKEHLMTWKDIQDILVGEKSRFLKHKGNMNRIGNIECSMYTVRTSTCVPTQDTPGRSPQSIRHSARGNIFWRKFFFSLFY